MFISYSHSVDGQLGPGLRDAMHQFARPWRRLRALRVFCDQRSMSANPAVWSSIVAALDRSRYFLLLASPQAAQSPWVTRELERWLTIQPRRPVLIGLTDGEIAWDGSASDFDWARTTALPPVLRGWFTEEPLWIDLRHVRGDTDLSLVNPVFADRVAALAAPLHNRSKDDLIGEDVRQHRRGMRFRRLSFLGLTVLTVLALFAGTVAYAQLGQVRQQRDRAEAEQRLATARGLVFEAESVRATDSATAVRLELAAVALDPTPQTRATLANDLASERFRGVVAHVASTARLSVVGDVLLANSGQNAVLWDWHHPDRRLATLPGRGNTDAAVALSRDGHLALVGFFDGTVDLWDVSRPTTPVKLSTMDSKQGPISTVAVSPDGQLALTGTVYSYNDGSPSLWDIRDRAHPQLLTGPKTEVVSTVNEAAFSPRAPVVAVGNPGNPDGVTLWDIRQPGQHRLLAQLKKANGISVRASSVAFSPDGTLLLAGSSDKVASLWNVSDPSHPRHLVDITDFGQAVGDVAFRPDGKAIMTAGSADNTVYTWDISNAAAPVRSLALTGPAAVNAAAYVGTTILVALGNGSIVAWDASRVDDLARTGAPAPALAGAGQITSSAGNAILLAGLPPVRTAADIAAAAISPDGRTAVVSGLGADTVSVVDVHDPTHPVAAITFDPQVQDVQEIAFHPDGHTALIGGSGSDDVPTVTIWDLARPTRPTRLGSLRRKQAGGLDALAVSPDGRSAFVGGFDEAALWNITDLKNPVQRTITTGLAAAGSGQVTSAAFSPDGHLLLVGGLLHAVLVDVTNPDNTTTAGDLPGNTDSVTGVAFSPNGQLALTGGFTDINNPEAANRTAILWLVTDPTQPRRLVNLTAQLGAVAFTADGRTAITDNGSGHPVYWDISHFADIAADPVAVGCAVAGGGLNKPQWEHHVPRLPYEGTCSAR